jgi:AraC family transcriptional regulator, transcriptional activator of pobA
LAIEIPYYADINKFLASTGVDARTDDPLFFCLRLRQHEGGIIYMPPFKRGFYFVGLLTAAQRTRITYDDTKTSDLTSLIVFQSPGLIYSFYRDSATHGYLIYFKPECFSYFKPAFEKEFPFFSMLNTGFFKLPDEKFAELSPHFEDVCAAYEPSKDHTVASLKLLALLYQIKALALFNNSLQENMTTPQQVLLQKYIALVNTHYIEKRTVEAYAEMLFVTPNHLSQTVKSITGKNALHFINERIIAEAKSLINYTQLGIAEISYRLDFSDPSNFGKFFKKHTGLTPLEFRESK